MIAGYVSDFCAVVSFLENFPHDVVMHLWPEHAALHGPEIDDVSYQVEMFGFHLLEKVEQKLRAAGPGAKVCV